MRLWAIALTLGLLFTAAAVGPASSTSAAETANVDYAASLLNVNENIVGPAFESATRYGYAGEGLGSVALASEIKSGLLNPDVDEFADASVNSLLMGNGNGNIERWYISFAKTKLVIGYDPTGPYAAKFKLAAKGKIPWYKPLLQKGLRLGRTDPQTDPKGYRTLFSFRLAEKLYHLKGFALKVLGKIENPNEVYPEQVLVSRLQTGEIDAGIFYLSEVKDIHIPYVNMPPRVNFGDPKYSNLYAQQTFTNDQGQLFYGTPIIYTISIPSTVQNRSAAVAFVKFVLGKRAKSQVKSHGLLPVPPNVYGDRSSVPAGLP